MIYRALNLFFKIFVYSSYRKKYQLVKDFRFNGFLIRIHGDGEIFSSTNCYISYYSYINLQRGSRLTLGSSVSIGHNVKIYTSSFDTETLIVSGVKKNKCGNVTIGSNVLIGANVFICPGVTIGDNSVIGANSVVSSNVLPNSVYAGCPAKLLKSYDN